MSRSRTTVLAVAGVLAIAGCGGAADEPAASASSTSSSPAASASATPTPTPTPSPTATKSGQLKIGKTYKDDFVSVTVQKVAIGAEDQYGDRYSGAIVKSCVVDPGEYDFIAFSWAPWAMIDDDSGRYPDSGATGGGLPTPVFPNGEQDGTFNAGECARGWIFFEVRKGTKVTAVRYQSGDMTKPVEWAVP